MSLKRQAMSQALSLTLKPNGNHNPRPNPIFEEVKQTGDNNVKLLQKSLQIDTFKLLS